MIRQNAFDVTKEVILVEIVRDTAMMLMQRDMKRVMQEW